MDFEIEFVLIQVDSYFSFTLINYIGLALEYEIIITTAHDSSNTLISSFKYFILGLK